MPDNALTLAHFGYRSLVPPAQADLDANDKSSRAEVGGVTFAVDQFGIRVFQYVRNKSGSAMVMGDVVSKVADVTITDINSPFGTTFINKTGAGLTVDAHIGKILYCKSGGATALTAPNGESGIIVANSATKVSIDEARPFSAAPVVDADFEIITPGWHVEDSADTDPARDVRGVVVGRDGIDDGNYGWVQNYGICPVAAVTSVAIVAGRGIVVDAKAFKEVAGGAAPAITAVDLICGYALGTVPTTSSGKALVFLTLFSGAGIVPTS